MGFALLAAMALFAALRMRVGNEITHLLPAGEDARLAYDSRAIAESELSRTMVLDVEAPDVDTAAASPRQLANDLPATPQLCLF
jgi:hypothetical protein